MIKLRYILLNEMWDSDRIFYHGSTDKKFLGKKGIHVGTYQAAKEALNARIGVPAKGDWDGSRVYGKTLLMGKKSLREMTNRGIYCNSGFNCGDDVPEEDYYPVDRKERADYSDRSLIPFTCRPVIFAVRIIGRMTNSYNSPHSDNVANGLMYRNLRSGNAKSGYYYKNEGEDEGSISAVVPNGTFLKIV